MAQLDEVERHPHARVRLPILGPFAVLLAGLIAASLYIDLRAQNAIRENEVNARVAATHRYIRRSFEQDKALMIALLRILEENAALQAVVRARDVAAAARLGAPLFKHMKEENGISHFYIMARDQTILARLHQPALYGDVNDRATAVVAARSGKVAAGFEVGWLGDVVLRVVVPLRQDGQVIGYLELGRDLERIIRPISHILNVDLVFLGRSGIDSADQLAIMASTVADIAPSLRASLERFVADGNARLVPQSGDDGLQIAGFALHDAAGRDTGILAVISDLSALEAISHRKMLAILGFYGVLGGLAFGLFYFLLGRIQRDVNDMHDHLEAHVKERTRALRLSEDRYRNLVEALPLAVLRYDVEGIITFSNGFLERNRGLAPGAVVGRPVFELFTSEMMRERLKKELPRRLREQPTPRPYVFDGWTPDGRILKIQADWNYDRDASGAIIGFTVVLQDITAREQDEEKLRQIQKMEVVGRLTGGLAHDFNNLLMVIDGSLFLLQERLGEFLEDDESVRGLLPQAREAARLGADLTQRLLAFSRKQSLVPERVNIAVLLEDMFGMLRQAVGEAIEITCRAAKNLPFVLVDRNQLENAVLNLAINARDAMSEGGVLNIHAEIVHLTKEEEGLGPDAPLAPGFYVSLTLQDSGCGIPAEIMDRIYDPFFTTKDAGLGTGLGLSMVYGFVKQSGGAIAIISSPEQGTRVRLFFPIAADQAADQEGGVIEAPETGPVSGVDSGLPMGRGEVVLAVEDNPLVLSLVTEMLESLGYVMLSATDGPQALDILRRAEKIDLLFSDVVLPRGMDGAELARQARGIAPDLKVLFTSGYAYEVITRSSAWDDRYRLLPKPYERAELARRIRQSLDDKG
jgi:PAS domain S-box-containing protein